MKTAPLLATFLSLALTTPTTWAAAPKSLPPAMVGGAKPGMKYGEVRSRLLRAGFKPVPRAKDEFCGYNDQCSLPETEACAGTGEANCTYRFSKGNHRLQVTGRYGEEGALSQQVVIIQFAD
jgi:hypothetical protein